ncbi:uncharacterized protein JCM6883_002369 [Sporobolomyces salmoneus]|uniref:uncharacterized protein n=1 Tax=Sporobolomyces salmoneus TaxID=183962 RepID=UPI00317C7887
MEDSYEHKATVTWSFDAEDIAKLKQLKTERKGSVYLFKELKYYPWELQLEAEYPEGGGDERAPTLTFFLTANPVAPQDYNRATSILAWSRGEASARFKIVSPIKPRETVASYSLEPTEFNSLCSGWGPKKIIEFDGFLDFYDKNGEIALCCSLTWSKPASLRLLPVQETLAHFDERTFADLVFRFPRDKQKPFIFASKSFLTVSADYFKTQIQPAKEDSELSDLSSENSTNANAESSRPQKRARVSESEVSNYGSKRIYVVDITETDFTTYRAMLSWLYCREVSFTALPSDYLVARDKALAEHLPTDPSFAFDPPELWLPKKFESLKGQRINRKIPPCSAHSMYRLADCYSINGLKRVAKDRILRCLTVENVAYELFSPLSIDYEEIQKPVLEFFVKNWAQVKKTTAFKNVLDKFAEGELARARELIETVFTLMRT